jgi:hypothetical protein
LLHGTIIRNNHERDNSVVVSPVPALTIPLKRESGRCIE